MAKWFEASVRHKNVMDDGQEKEVVSKFLVEDASISCAERRISEEVSGYMDGEFDVESIAGKNIAGVFHDANGDGVWYRCKLMYSTLDEKSGKEKKTANVMMIQAAGFERAVASLKEYMRGSMADWEISAVQETAIAGVYSMDVDN